MLSRRLENRDKNCNKSLQPKATTKLNPIRDSSGMLSHDFEIKKIVSKQLTPT